MGRIKVLFCSLCLDRNQDQTSEHAFNQSVDVSHLATPHISSSNLSASLSLTCDPRPADESLAENNNALNHQYKAHNNILPPAAATTSHQGLPEVPSRRESISRNNSTLPHTPSQSQLENRATHQPTPPPPSRPSPSPVSNPYNSQQQSERLRQPQQQAQQHREMIRDVPDAGPSSEQTSNKLSYDVISVREPLAKILAERQQLLAQQHRLLNIGDHDYIEVYEERGSSCFYEEIAGSVTSSATYDQIGATSNHNYQALVNAVTNRVNAINPYEVDGQDNINDQPPDPNRNPNEDVGGNIYDVTQHQSLHRRTDNGGSHDRPSTSYGLMAHDNNETALNANLKAPVPSDRSSLIAQSIPVYSVINKATRRNNSILRASIESTCPPRPPPKNLISNSQQATSAISASIGSHSDRNETSPSPTKQPQPPPRMSKHPMYNVSDRPLPLPEQICDTSSNKTNGDTNSQNNNNISTTNQNSSSQDDDSEAMNNGYELLRSNFDDDQIDVGYEKIREPNRYSGGSISSHHLYSRHHILDNDGYESVQPIYSSPSNALVEPNYEAIGPSTAAELTAAATAKLTAAAQLSKTLDQQINL